MGILLKKSGEEGIIEITKRVSMNYKAFFDEGFIYYTSPMFSLISSIICDLPFFWKWPLWALKQLKCWNGAGKVPKRMLEKGNFKIQV